MGPGVRRDDGLECGGQSQRVGAYSITAILRTVIPLKNGTHAEQAFASEIIDQVTRLSRLSSNMLSK